MVVRALTIKLNSIPSLGGVSYAFQWMRRNVYREDRSMSIADRFVTELMPSWLRKQKHPAMAITSNTKKVVRRQAATPRPTVAFKPKPVNPEQYSTHL